MPWTYSFHLSYYPRWEVQHVYVPPPPQPPLAWPLDYVWGLNGVNSLNVPAVPTMNMWVPPAQVAPAAPVFPAPNVAGAMANVAWPINPIPGRTILVSWEANDSAAPCPLLKSLCDSLRGFFGCRCTPFNAVPGFGGHGWGCILNMVLITGVLAWIFTKVSSSAFSEGLREAMGTAGE